MASEKAEKAEKVTAEATTNPTKGSPESVYTVRELAANHKAFGVFPELVIVALRQAGKETYTFPEAKRLVEEFSNKEV